MNEKWKQTDLDRYISEKVEENAFLEYKSAEALDKSLDKKKKIAKEISAMANAAGGIIIYGIKEYQKEEKKHLPEKLDPVDRTQFSREWFDQVINYNIYPRIEGLQVYPVELDTGKNDVAYVVEIPQSMTAHQVITDKDYRYYERANFENVSMPDFRIRDVMNRGVAPNAEVKFTAQKLRDRYLLNIRIVNCGKKIIRYMKLKFSFPNFNNAPAVEPSGTPAGIVETGENTSVCFIEQQKYLYQINYYSETVLFPEEIRDITDKIDLKYCIYFPTRDEKFIEWTLYADSMPPKNGKIKVYDLEN